MEPNSAEKRKCRRYFLQIVPLCIMIGNLNLSAIRRANDILEEKIKGFVSYRFMGAMKCPPKNIYWLISSFIKTVWQ